MAASDSGQNSGEPASFLATDADWETDLELPAGLNVGVLAGYGLIILGLTILLIGLVWSGTRRLRNLADDPRAIRLMIVSGLILAGAGVIIGALAIRAG